MNARRRSRRRRCGAYERLLADDDVEIEVDEYGRGPGMLPQKALPIARLVGYFASASIDGDGTRSLWTAQEWHGVRRAERVRG